MPRQPKAARAKSKPRPAPEPAPTPPKRKPGRPAGSKRKTASADDLQNELFAHWGPRGGSLGGAVAHQAWIERHPSKTITAHMAELHHEEAAAFHARLTAERQAEPLSEWASREITRAIDDRNAEFFMDMAATLARLIPDGSIRPYDPADTALLAYVSDSQFEHAARRRAAGQTTFPPREFAVNELLDGAQWGADANGVSWRPSRRELVRMARRLNIPLRPQAAGRPAKK